ncbi:hypothetical protein B0H13DRAFT_1488456, partial [Mycena leptocephala]
WPEYYDLIKQPISMKNIKSFSQKATHYETLAEYQEAWHRLFDNAREFNEQGSQIYQDADTLQ